MGEGAQFLDGDGSDPVHVRATTSSKSVQCELQFDCTNNLAVKTIDTNILHLAQKELMYQQGPNVNDIKFIEDLLLAHKIINSGLPNRYGCRIPVKTKWNINLFSSLLTDYHDQDVIEWLTYGFPVSRDPFCVDPVPATRNHAGATQFPEHVDEYFRTELAYSAVMGPFTIPPFLSRIGISPISTRAKKNSSKRRIILDLSYPPGRSVNDGIMKDYYMGQYTDLTYPTIDTLVARILELGPGTLIWKIDLSRAFRVLPLCPGDYSLIGMRWRNLLYFDKFLPMGLRTAAYCMQKVSSAIVYIHRKMGYWSTNYLDDFGSAERADIAQNSFQALRMLLHQLGDFEAVEKACEPSTRMEFLGTTIDTIKMTIEISPERLVEIYDILQNWRNRSVATRREVESLIGKLSFVSNCVKAARVFMTRIIDSLATFSVHQNTEIPLEMHKDIEWWLKFIKQYNGISLMWLHDALIPDVYLATDACLTGAGAICNDQYFHAKFPPSIKERFNNIALLEMIAIILSLKLWKQQLQNSVIRLYCDNQNCVCAVNSGRTKDVLLAACLRELSMVAAENNMWIKLEYINTRKNKIPDLLSRWYNNDNARHLFKAAMKKQWRRKSVSSSFLEFCLI